MDHAAIMGMRKVMAEAITDWMPDNSSPPNFVRETGMGREVARVEVHMSGYQWAHTPIVIGWHVRSGSNVDSGMVMVADCTRKGEPAKRGIERAIEEAKHRADEAWEEVKAA